MKEFNTLILTKDVILSVLTSYVNTKFNINKNDINSIDFEYSNEVKITFVDNSFTDEKKERKKEV